MLTWILIDPLSALARHRKRNYVFGLDTTFAIDATSAGNISRYINHADDANCYSRCEWLILTR